jgi:cyclase
VLKRRLIPVLNILNGLIVRSEGFSIHQNIGNIVNEAARYNEWEVDELIYLDISRRSGYDLRRDDHKIASYSTIEEVISRISKVCFMPLTFGGGIRTLEDVDVRIQNGADKITLNTKPLEDLRFVEMVANKYGSQAVVLSIDYKVLPKGPVVFDQFGQHDTGIPLYDWVVQCQNAGAGELFINSIDRDGKANGFDVETINRVCSLINAPVIACGGAGQDDDFIELAQASPVSAIAAGNFFHFTEHSYPRIKRLLKQANINVR